MRIARHPRVRTYTSLIRHHCCIARWHDTAYDRLFIAASKAMKSDTVLAQTVDSSRFEEGELDLQIDEVRAWMREVGQLGVPHFGETATRLGQVRGRLVQHFEREDAIVDELARQYSPSSPEIAVLRCQSSRDQGELLNRLDELCERLLAPDPPFESWQSAMREVDHFAIALERHEDQESESVERLMAHGMRDA